MKDKHYKVQFDAPLSDWQKDVKWHVDESSYRFFVAVIGRQSGKSYLAKRILLDRAINRKQICMWVAPSIPSVRGHWKDLVDLIKSSNIPVQKIREASKEIFFYGGGSIVIRSALEPDNLRGPSLDFVVLDEAAFFRQGEYVWLNVLLPMLTATNGRALFTTTPNGRNWLWSYYQKGMGKDSYYKSFHYTSADSPYQDKALLEELKETMPSVQWKQEYEAEFLVSGSSVFVGVMDAAKIKQIDKPIDGHTYICGIDVGHNANFTAITFVDKYTREQVFGTRFSNIGTTEPIRRIAQLLYTWNPEKTYIEVNGIGQHFFSLLKETLGGIDIEDIVGVIQARMDDPTFTNEVTAGGHKLIGVHMTNELKVELVNRLAGDIEYGRLSLLDETSAYGQTQMSEMSTYERRMTPTETAVSYHHKEGETDDTITALYLAYRGVPKPKRWRLPKENKEVIKNPFRGRGKRLKNAKRN